MGASGNNTNEQVTGPVVITVHGTFAGNLRENPPYHWWQSKAALALQLLDRFGVEPTRFEWKDNERTGPNRESERRIAGRRLFNQLSELGKDGTPYHLVGHSHGGSVIWHALKESARAGKQLNGLKSWTTVSTPFIEFGPDGSWLRHLLGAIAAIVALYFFGFWQLALDLAKLATQRNPQLLLDRLPLSNELSDLHAAFGDWLYYVLLAGVAATVVFFLVVILFPLKDLFHTLITKPRERRAMTTAAEWYEPLWLGLLHPKDEAMAGLKATLIRAPDLVLRQRRGLAALMFAPIKPFARPVDEFAWSTLMKNAQGDDIVDEVVRRIANAPEPFARGPNPLSATVIASITTRADAASATVLARLRDRISALSNQADVAALVAIMSGTYDEDSLIHTSMFDEPAVCGAIVAQIEAAAVVKPEPVDARSAAPPRALTRAKALVAVALVALVSVLASAAYRILVYPETNLAAAEAILARFDDPAFQGLANDDAPGKAIVRAHRLGVPFDRAMSVAEKLRDEQTRSQAHQLLLRELALAGRTNDLLNMLTTPSDAPYRRVDYLAASLAAALDAIVRSPTPSPDGPQLLQATADLVNRSFVGTPPQSLLERLVPVAVALENANGLTWIRRIGEADPECKNWDAIVSETAALIGKEVQASALNALIAVCKPKTGAEDRLRLLRRIAIGALPECKYARTLMEQASTHQVGKDAPVTAHFIKCLLQDERKAKDAIPLVREALRLKGQTSKTDEIRQMWQMSEVLKAGGLAEDARQWAEKAVRFTTEPDKQEEKERDTILQFNNDALKLEILAATDQGKRDAFIALLARDANAFNSGGSKSFSSSWASLRHIYATHATLKPGTCVIKEADLRLVHTQIMISAYEPTKNPSAIATVILSLANRCTIEMYAELLEEMIKIVSGNNIADVRAGYIVKTAPFQKNLRRAMATAETAALPSEILKGYVASIDRHRPLKRKQAETEFRPIRYVPLSASTSEIRR